MKLTKIKLIMKKELSDLKNDIRQIKKGNIKETAFQQYENGALKKDKNNNYEKEWEWKCKNISLNLHPQVYLKIPYIWKMFQHFKAQKGVKVVKISNYTK